MGEVLLPDRTKAFAKPVESVIALGTAASVLAGCQVEATVIPETATSLLTVDAAKAMLPWAAEPFSNSAGYEARLTGNLLCATNPSDTTGATLETFHLQKADGTLDTTKQYAFCVVPVEVKKPGGEEYAPVGSAIFLITHDTQANSSEATMLVLEGTAAGPEGIYDAATLGTDHRVSIAPFKMEYDGETFSFIREATGREKMVSPTQTPETTTNVINVVFKPVNTARGEFSVTPTVLPAPPAPAVTTTETSAPTPEPSKTETAMPTETPTATPTEKVCQELQSIIDTNAEFPQRGENISESGELEVRYANSVLDYAGIDSIQVDPAAMDRAWGWIVNDTYNYQKMAEGETLIIGSYRNTTDERFYDSIVGSLGRAKIFVVNRDEFTNIRERLLNSERICGLSILDDLGATETSPLMAYFDNEGTLIVISRSSFLSNISSDWDRKDAVMRIIADGLGRAGVTITKGIRRQGWMPNPIYEAFNCRANNNFCTNGDQGLFNVTFE